MPLTCSSVTGTANFTVIFLIIIFQEFLGQGFRTFEVVIEKHEKEMQDCWNLKKFCNKNEKNFQKDCLFDVAGKRGWLTSRSFGL